MNQALVACWRLPAVCLSLPAMCSGVSEFPKSQLNHHMEEGQEIYTVLAPGASCYQGNTQSAPLKDEDDQTWRQTKRTLQYSVTAPKSEKTPNILGHPEG